MKNYSKDPIVQSIGPEAAEGNDNTSFDSRQRIIFDLHKLQDAGFKGVEARVVDGKIELFYHPLRGPDIFNPEAIELLSKQIGDEDCENLAIKAHRIFERGTIMSLLSK